MKKISYAKNNCFGANYINALLTERFGHGRLKEITLANLQNGFKLGWTLDRGLLNTGNADE